MAKLLDERLFYGNALMKRRELAGLTKADLARAVGIDISNIGKYERGERVPSISTAIKIYNYLEVELDKKLNGR